VGGVVTGSRLADVIAHGNRCSWPYPDSYITCADGYRLSIVAGRHTRCEPTSPLYTSVEVGFPSSRPEPWTAWEEYCESPDNPTGTVYSYVPVRLVRALIESHGGEV
jgi:hypothetical protein